MIKYQKYTVICALLFFVISVQGYGLPGLGLGFANILDGGPLRPNPGIYWQNWLQYYTTQRFLNDKGKPLLGFPSPHFRQLEYVTRLSYQFERRIFGAMPGLSMGLPFLLLLKIDKNELGLKSSGSGFGNLGCNGYLQWPAVYNSKGRPVFINRLEFDFAIPLGKNELPKKNINPNNTFFYCGPSWSGTVYMSHEWTLSWHWHYVWSAKNEKVNFRAGDAIYGATNIAYAVSPHWYIAAVSYALQQLHNNKADGITVPHSKERVFGVGPGVAYYRSRDLVFFTYLYLEAGARNHTQGTNFIMRLFLHF
jgi:hypothetical protein